MSERRGGQDQVFLLTEAHLRLLRQAIVVWVPFESGAPAILVSPLAGGPQEQIEADIARRAGLVVEGAPVTTEDRQRAKELISELPEALAQLLAHGDLPAGSYHYVNRLLDIPQLASYVPAELGSLATDPAVDFEFTDQHALLLRATRWEDGQGLDRLIVNAKRPYGDMTYFELDMAEILGEPVVRRPNGALPLDDERRLSKLYTETLPALQVYLENATLAPGQFSAVGLRT